MVDQADHRKSSARAEQRTKLAMRFWYLIPLSDLRYPTVMMKERPGINIQSKTFEPKFCIED